MIIKLFTRRKREVSLSILCAFVLTTVPMLFAKFVNEPSDLIMMPWDRILLEKETPLKLGSFFSNTSDRLGISQANTPQNNSNTTADIIYIFVLDVSKSLSDSIDPPHWMDKSLANINSFLDKPYNISIGQKVEIFDVARVRLADMLVSTLSTNSFNNEYFSIWTVGNSGKLVYPNKEDRLKYSLSRRNMVKVDEQYINASIFRVNELKKNGEYTDFTSLFDQIMDSYKKQITYNSNRYNSGTIIITILSDLLHDVDDKNEYSGRVEKIKENWKYLEEKINKMSNANIVANMIVVTPTGKIEHIENKQIYIPFKSTFDSYRLTKSKVSETIQNKLLYPPEFPEQAMNFYYENNTFLNNVQLVTSFDIPNLLIEMPLMSGMLEQEDIKFEWSIVGATLNGKSAIREWGGLSSRGEVFNRNLDKFQMIQLKPILNLKQISSKAISVRIVNQDLHRVYHVKINFIELLSLPIAWLIAIFQLIFLMVLVPPQTRSYLPQNKFQ